MWLGNHHSEHSREELIKSYIKSVVSYVATNGTDDKLLNQHGKTSNISIDEKSLNRTGESIFEVIKNLREVSVPFTLASKITGPFISFFEFEAFARHPFSIMGIRVESCR